MGNGCVSLAEPVPCFFTHVLFLFLFFVATAFERGLKSKIQQRGGGRRAHE